MTRPTSRGNPAASVLARLLNHAQNTGEDYQFVLTHFVLERFMYRLGRSEFKERFVVKGALLFLTWSNELYRPTRDLDLMAISSVSEKDVSDIFQKICAVPTEEDAVRFDPGQMEIEPIREEETYAGLRVRLPAFIGKAEIPLKVDIGFGDVITPGAKQTVFPVLLDFPPPALDCYPPETVVAEKLDAIIKLGIINSRMKDYFDIWILARTIAFEGQILSDAFNNTFKRRKRILPDGIPVGLTNDFACDETKSRQWKAFIRRSRLTVTPPDLDEVILAIRGFVIPPYESAQSGTAFAQYWPMNGPWQ